MKTNSPLFLRYSSVAVLALTFGLSLVGCSSSSDTPPPTPALSQALAADSFTQCLREKQSVDAINGKDSGLMPSDHVAECKKETLSTESIEAEAMKPRK